MRALLQRPASAVSYPPSRLREVLHAFGRQALEAVPILLEALAVDDYETRLYSASGLRTLIADRGEWDGISSQVFDLARPALARILQSPNEPSLIRTMALDAFAPPIIRMDGQPTTAETLLPGAREDLVLALRAGGPEGFGFTIVDKLAGYVPAGSRDGAAFREALAPMLQDPNSAQRLLAAYAMASWPGETTPPVKAELVQALRESSKFAHHAADALAKLGPAAADAAPDLLAFAEAAKDWGAGYRERALEAACRLNPELRSQFPEVDEKLKIEEQPPSSRALTSASFADWVVSLDKLGDDAFAEVLRNALPAGTDGAQARSALAALLRNELDQAAGERRPGLERALHFLESGAAGLPRDSEPPIRPVSLAALAFDARVLLADQDKPQRQALEGVLAEFEAGRREMGGPPVVTAENFATLAQALSRVDPTFQKEWRQAVMKNYPWLDRVVGKPKN